MDWDPDLYRTAQFAIGSAFIGNTLRHKFRHTSYVVQNNLPEKAKKQRKKLMWTESGLV